MSLLVFLLEGQSLNLSVEEDALINMLWLVRSCTIFDRLVRNISQNHSSFRQRLLVGPLIAVFAFKNEGNNVMPEKKNLHVTEISLFFYPHPITFHHVESLSRVWLVGNSKTMLYPWYASSSWASRTSKITCCSSVSCKLWRIPLVKTDSLF